MRHPLAAAEPRVRLKQFDTLGFISRNPMLTRRTLLFVSAAAVAAGLHAQAPTHPKLVLAIAVDQFRYDYLTRFRADYSGGFKTLLTQGAVFTNARYEHVPTVTAIGHSTFLSGATPSMSGIIGNDWYDRASGKKVTSVTDASVQLLGGSENPTGSSPRRMLVSTLGDEMKIVDPRTRVIGVSLKDRSAILPAGHMANGAYWFDNNSGSFVSSTYYFPDLPDWVKAFNASHPADRYAGKQWNAKTFVAAGPKLYASLPASPWGNELIEEFAERAMQSEQMGRGPQTDLLAVSFSSNDYVGHAVGPDDPAVRDMATRTDKLIAKLFAFIDQQVGMRNVVVVLTADHGVAPVPEVNQKRKMPGGRLAGDPGDVVQQVLTAKYGEAKWVAGTMEYGVYLDWKVIDEKKLNRREVAEVATDAVRALPHIFRAFTYDALLHGEIPHDFVGERVTNGFYPQRSADVFYLPEPYWLSGKTGTTHGTPFGYDTHVPVIFMGPGIKAGIYNEAIRPNDIAPTLATLLSVETPSGSVGRALAEILK
jgi:arylsulfatase A-like enzyme